MTKIDKSRYAEAVRLWAEWNEKINVVSRKDIDFLFEHHIVHCLAIALYMERFVLSDGESLQGASFLDLGTGGGFPGIPLAMEYPEAKFTLCDSVGKKVKVAQAVADGLGLRNVTCVQARVEELPGRWDWVVSRAVAPLDTLYGWVRGKFDRSLICLKGGDVNEEISLLLRRYGKGPGGIKPSQIRTWPIIDILEDDYFAEKFVIEIGKSYLCNPFDEKIKKSL